MADDERKERIAVSAHKKPRFQHRSAWQIEKKSECQLIYAEHTLQNTGLQFGRHCRICKRIDKSR